jgi:outer membrane immunogenic protein
LPEWNRFASYGSLNFLQLLVLIPSAADFIPNNRTSKGEIMKRTLIASAAFASLLAAATSAFAADLPVKAPVAVAAVYDWTGFYIGTNLGYSWGRGSTDGNLTRTSLAVVAVVPTVVLPLTGRADVNGFIGGGQLGYNWQRGTWLFGLEGDIQFSNERRSGDVCTVAGCPAGSFQFTRDYKLDWFGTARGRVGYLPAERILLYATGGLAYGGFSGSSLFGVVGANALDLGSWSSTRAGWTVGAGAEAALGSNWSVKFEYLYLDLGNVGGSTATLTNVLQVRSTAVLAFNTKFTDSIARVGLNYKFGGPAAVVAKY